MDLPRIECELFEIQDFGPESWFVEDNYNYILQLQLYIIIVFPELIEFVVCQPSHCVHELCSLFHCVFSIVKTKLVSEH